MRENRPAGAGRFCDEAWSAVGRLVGAIVDHPFNRRLAGGDLDPDVFTFYVAQDAHYLEGFARALAAAAVRAPLPEETALWSGAASDAIVAERDMHERWLAARESPDRAGIGIAPTCLAYSSWLQAAALSCPYPVLAASLLPCYWVYEHVGGWTVQRAGASGHPYAEWIAMYSAAGYADLVAKARAATERAWVGAGQRVRQAMIEAFVRGTELEWLFFDAAWRREQWPTARYLGGAA